MNSKDKPLIAYISAGLGIMFCMIALSIFCLDSDNKKPSVASKTPDSGYSTNIVNIDDGDTPSAVSPDSTLQPSDIPLTTDIPQSDQNDNSFVTTDVPSECVTVTDVPSNNIIENTSPSYNNTVTDKTSSDFNNSSINDESSTTSSNTLSNATNNTSTGTQISPSDNIIYNDSYTKRY